jgi:hypothetical protein
MMTFYSKKIFFIFLSLFILTSAVCSSLESKATAREESITIGLLPEITYSSRENALNPLLLI